MRRLTLVLTLLLLAASAQAGPADRPASPTPAEREALAKELGRTSELFTVLERADDGCAIVIQAELEHIDVRKLLPALGRVSDVNVVVADDISGKVTLALGAASVFQTFYAVLEQVGGYAHGDVGLLVVSRIPKQIPAGAWCGNCMLGWLRPWPHGAGVWDESGLMPVEQYLRGLRQREAEVPPAPVSE